MSLPAVNSPVKREVRLISVLSAKNYPISAAIVGILNGSPIITDSILTGATAYSIQTPLASVLAIATNFPAT